MTEKILHEISAGSQSIYQIVDSSDGVSIILRETEEPNNRVHLMKSMIPLLVQMLSGIK